MKLINQALLCAVLLLSCQSITHEEKHVFYLHGRIIEFEGVNAVSEQFGKYEYNDIIDSLKSTGAVVHNEVRTAQIDFQAFCEHTSNQINQLVESGVKPKNITLIGASKGAVMAMYISNENTHPINYVLLGANNERMEHQFQWNLHGSILGIYEKSDSLAGRNYQHWINESTNAVKFEQIEINTGLGHGFLYRPINEWWHPTKKWMENGSKN